MNVMNIKEAYEWIKENTSLMEDTFMLDFECLYYAVKKKLLLQVDTEHFVLPTFAMFDSIYSVDSVYRCSDEEIKELQLYYPYRLKAHLIEAGGDYKENIIKYHKQLDLAIVF